jgi:hypothetical protein
MNTTTSQTTEIPTTQNEAFMQSVLLCGVCRGNCVTTRDQRGHDSA